MRPRTTQRSEAYVRTSSETTTRKIGTQEDSALQAQFKVLADTLTRNEEKIVVELAAVLGKSADIGGYYLPDPRKCEAVMRPSPTFNAALVQRRQITS